MANQPEFTSSEAAAYVGMPASDWRARVARGYAPEPDKRVGRMRIWYGSTLDDYLATGPKRGPRSGRPHHTAIVPPQKETTMTTIYAVVHEGRTGRNDGQRMAYGFYTTNRLAEAVGDAIREHRVPERYWYNNPVVVPMEASDTFEAATYATFMDTNLDYLVIDPDGQYPWPGKLNADGWRRKA